LRNVGLAQAQRLRVAPLAVRDQLAPRARRVDAARRRLERMARALDVLAPQLLERAAVERQQVLALELVVHPTLADRETAAHPAAEIAIQELLELDEPDPGARGGMLDALGFAGECAQQLAHQAVHERGPAGVPLRRDVAV